MSRQLLIPPIGKKVSLSDYDPGYTGKYRGEEEVHTELEDDLRRLAELQDRLYAAGSHALLIVLQGIDTGGKDGTISHVFRGLNPQGVQVTAFKTPTPLDLAHDFLWRIHAHIPPKGIVGVFNRSHYEDVLVVRVHELVPRKVWKKRYDQINAFEEMLTEQGVVLLKFFLYISKDEQKRRFEDRLNDPNKSWKFSVADLKERARWDDYIEAYEHMLTRCNSEFAPWYIVPANHKWYRNLIITRAIVETLDKLDLKYPPPAEGLDQIVIPD